MTTNDEHPVAPDNTKPANDRLMAIVVFCGERPSDPDRAAAELAKAGYEVFRLPYGDPLDDFIEVRIAGPDDPKIIDAVWVEVERIVAPCGGWVEECGPIEPYEPPFADFEARKWADLFKSK